MKRLLKYVLLFVVTYAVVSLIADVALAQAATRVCSNDSLYGRVVETDVKPVSGLFARGPGSPCSVAELLADRIVGAWEHADVFAGRFSIWEFGERWSLSVTYAEFTPRPIVFAARAGRQSVSWSMR